MVFLGLGVDRTPMLHCDMPHLIRIRAPHASFVLSKIIKIGRLYGFKIVF